MTREEAKDYIREWCPYNRQEEIIEALEQEPITKITRKYCVQDEGGYTDEELVNKINEIIDRINKEK